MAPFRSSVALLSTPMLAGLSWSVLPASSEDAADGYATSEASESEAPPPSSYLDASQRGHVVLETSAFLGTTTEGTREVGGWLGIALPLERLWAPRPPPRPRSALAEGDPAARHHAPPAKPGDATTPPPRTGRLSPSLARACVAAAWRANGLGSMSDLDDMSGRARMAGLLPEARFRASRSWDRGQKLTPTDSDPYRLQDSTTASQLIEGRLTWRLDRLLFTDDEIAVEKLRAQRIQQRTNVAGKVLTALFDWHRARQAADNTTLTDEERMDAWLRASEAEAALDVLTGGWFSGWVERNGG